MQYMSQEMVDVLWPHILAEVDRIKQIEHKDNDGSSRSEAMAHSDGRTLSVILDLSLDDGSHVVYHIMATHKTFAQQGPNIKLKIKKYYHNAEDFWNMQLEDRSNAIVIDHKHYRVVPETSQTRIRGFGGRKYTIQLLEDLSLIRTNNLWYQGVIPPALWPLFPDNARFIDEDKLSRVKYER